MRILDELPEAVHSLGASTVQEVVGTLDARKTVPPEE
jgi:hypothetical protein